MKNLSELDPFLQAGFEFVLLDGKRPIHTDWRNVTVLPGTAEAHVKGGGNVGLKIPPGFLVVDVDKDRGGLESLEKLDQDVNLRVTRTTKTGSDGLHLFFTLDTPPDTLFRAKLDDYPGIDFLTEGRQVVAPPSVHPTTGKPYTFETRFLSFAALDQAVIDRLKIDQHAAPAYQHDPLPFELVLKILDTLNPEDFSDYHDWLELGMALHAGTHGDPDAGAAWADWSREDPAYADFEDQEYKWKSFNSEGVTVRTLLKLLNNHDQAELADLVGDHVKPKASDEFEPIDQGADPVGIDRPLYQFYTSSEVEAFEDPNWLIKDLLPEQGYMVVAGPRGVGKSLIGIDLAARLAGGHSYMNRPPAPPMRVAYVDRENRPTLKKRMAAWRIHYGLDWDPENLVFGFETPALAQATEGAKKQFDNFLDALEAYAPDIVIVDTLAASMSSGATVNDGRDVATALSSLDLMRNRTGAALCLMAHVGKDQSRGAKGFTEIEDWADLVLQVFTKKDSAKLIPTKVRHGELPRLGWPVQPYPVQIADDVTAPVILMGSGSDLPVYTEGEDDEPLADRLIGYVLKNQPVSGSAIVDHLGVRKAEGLAEIKRLIETGDLQRGRTGIVIRQKEDWEL